MQFSDAGDLLQEFSDQIGLDVGLDNGFAGKSVGMWMLFLSINAMGDSTTKLTRCVKIRRRWHTGAILWLVWAEDLHW